MVGFGVFMWISTSALQQLAFILGFKWTFVQPLTRNVKPQGRQGPGILLPAPGAVFCVTEVRLAPCSARQLKDSRRKTGSILKN